MAQYAAFGDIHFTRDYTVKHREAFDEAKARQAVINDRLAVLKKQLGAQPSDADVANETEAASIDFASEVARLIEGGSLVDPNTLYTAPDLAAQLNAARDRTAELERQLAEFQALRDGLAPQFTGGAKGAPATAAEIVSTPATKAKA